MTDAGKLHRETPKFGKSPVDMLLDQSISDGAARQYAYMHWRYGANKQNFEGRESIAEAMGVSERTITKRNAELEQADWIIVLRQYDPKTRKTRNFYHVFEIQADCAAYRKEHSYEKPEAKPEQERKLRTGKGGKPTHKGDDTPEEITNVNSSSDRGNVNSSSHTNVNSSSAYLDSDHPDTKDQNLTPSPNGAACEPGMKFGFTIDEQLFWEYTPPGGYGYVQNVPCRIVGFTDQQVRIMAQMANGNEEKRTVTPSKLRRTPKEPNYKTLADLDPLKKVIARRSHRIKLGQGITERTMVRINTAFAELRDRFQENMPSPNKLDSAYTWYGNKPGNPELPKGAKVGDMMEEYNDAHRPAAGPGAPVEALDPHEEADPNCALCRGNGVVKASGHIVPCDCRKRKAAVS